MFDILYIPQLRFKGKVYPIITDKDGSDQPWGWLLHFSNVILHHK